MHNIYKPTPSKSVLQRDTQLVHETTLTFSLPLTTTPQNLSHYIAYTSKFIASAPKYLTGACHFLQDLYPDFDTNCSHPLVQATICGSKKVCTDPIQRKQPLHTSHLETFLHVACLSKSYDDLLFAMLLSCCFYGCCKQSLGCTKNHLSQKAE